MSIEGRELSIDVNLYLRHQNRKIGRFTIPEKAMLRILEDRSQESILICEDYWHYSNLPMKIILIVQIEKLVFFENCG